MTPVKKNLLLYVILQIRSIGPWRVMRSLDLARTKMYSKGPLALWRGFNENLTLKGLGATRPALRQNVASHIVD
jgi:hypothetical protein